MIMFVTTAEDPSGALVPIRLPEGVAVLDLVDPPSYMRRFQLRWSREHSTGSTAHSGDPPESQTTS